MVLKRASLQDALIQSTGDVDGCGRALGPDCGGAGAFAGPGFPKGGFGKAGQPFGASCDGHGRSESAVVFVPRKAGLPCLLGFVTTSMVPLRSSSRCCRQGEIFLLARVRICFIGPRFNEIIFSPRP